MPSCTAIWQNVTVFGIKMFFDISSRGDKIGSFAQEISTKMYNRSRATEAAKKPYMRGCAQGMMVPASSRGSRKTKMAEPRNNPPKKSTRASLLRHPSTDHHDSEPAPMSRRWREASVDIVPRKTWPECGFLFPPLSPDLLKDEQEHVTYHRHPTVSAKYPPIGPPGPEPSLRDKSGTRDAPRMLLIPRLTCYHDRNQKCHFPATPTPDTTRPATTPEERLAHCAGRKEHLRFRDATGRQMENGT
jgi:hypothetical protein